MIIVSVTQGANGLTDQAITVAEHGLLVTGSQADHVTVKSVLLVEFVALIFTKATYSGRNLHPLSSISIAGRNSRLVWPEAFEVKVRP